MFQHQIELTISKQKNGKKITLRIKFDFAHSHFFTFSIQNQADLVLQSRRVSMGQGSEDTLDAQSYRNLV